MHKKITSVTCQDIKGKEYKVSPEDLTFRPAVYGVVIKDDKILLQKCWDGYDFPGGGIDLGEPTKEALVREVKEETGMDVSVGEIVFCNNSFFKLPYKDNFVHSIHMYYKCEVTGGELSTEFFDVQEKKYADMPEWVSLSEIGNIKMYCSTDVSEVLKGYL